MITSSSFIVAFRNAKDLNKFKNKISKGWGKNGKERINAKFNWYLYDSYKKLYEDECLQDAWTLISNNIDKYNYYVVCTCDSIPTWLIPNFADLAILNAFNNDIKLDDEKYGGVIVGFNK